MVQDKKLRNEVIMAGIGGMGVLVAGRVLLWAASQQYEQVSFLPSYGFARRGGNSECTVVFSNERISSPLQDQAQVVILFDSSQFGTYESRVRSGGLIIAEKSGFIAERVREDYQLYALPAMEIAVSLGESVFIGLIMLGAYTAITGSVSPKLIEGELQRRYGDKKKVLGRNVDAFRRGLELGKSAR